MSLPLPDFTQGSVDLGEHRDRKIIGETIWELGGTSKNCFGSGYKRGDAIRNRHTALFDS